MNIDSQVLTKVATIRKHIASCLVTPQFIMLQAETIKEIEDCCPNVILKESFVADKEITLKLFDNFLIIIESDLTRSFQLLCVPPTPTNLTSQQ